MRFVLSFRPLPLLPRMKVSKIENISVESLSTFSPNQATSARQEQQNAKEEEEIPMLTASEKSGFISDGIT